MAYEKMSSEELILRDKLAIERTRLAEERTYLAYIRTGMSLALGGIFFLGYFAPGSAFYDVGLVTLAVSVLFVAYGFYHHKKSMGLIDRITFGVFRLRRE